MKRLYVLTIFSVILAVTIFYFKERKPTTVAAGEGLVIPKTWLAANLKPITPKADLRPADQTFLTFPEWYLVFSPEEQAAYYKSHTSSSFPFVSHIAQIWESYNIVKAQIKDNFPPNSGYHFMIWVIGTSATVEYAIKAGYEKIIGRITDTEFPVTDEDRFNADFTSEYVEFIKDKPWYAFDFKSQLIKLWKTSSLVDHHLLRKAERKYFLTTELLVKYGYGKLIGLGTKQVYEEALPTTAVVLDNDSLVYLPRYQQFGKAATKLAAKGYGFKEIAGNHSAILVSILVPVSRNPTFENTKMLFIQPISANPGLKRLVLAVPVPSLPILLLQIDEENITLEHLFDY